jgi:hypothetical protein
VAKRLLVLSLITTEAGAAAPQHRFQVLDPTNHDLVMTVTASEQDANRVQERLLRQRPQAPVWAEFRDAIVIEDRAPIPRELRDRVGFWRRTLTWRPRPVEARDPRRTSNLLTSDLGGAAGAVAGIAFVASSVAVLAAQMFGVFGWLFLGYAIYLVGALLLFWGLRYVRIDESWKVRIAVAIPLPVVVLIGFAARGMIHPAFAWSNALLFFSR